MARVLPNCTDRMFDVGLLNFTQPSFWKYILTAVRQLLRLSLCFCPCEYSLHVCVNSPWNAPGTRGCFAFQCSSDFEQFEQKIRAVDGGTHGWTAPGSLGEPPPGLTGSHQPNLQALLHHTPSVAVCFGRWTDGAAIRSTSTSFGRCWAEVSGRMKLEPCPCRCLIPSQSLVRTSLHCAALEPCCEENPTWPTKQVSAHSLKLCLPLIAETTSASRWEPRSKQKPIKARMSSAIMLAFAVSVTTGDW